MFERSLACGVLVLAAAAAGPAQAQSMWWVEGDRFCSGFSNQFSNRGMCGPVRRGETVPSSTFRYEFQTPALGQENPPPAPPPPVARPQRR